MCSIVVRTYRMRRNAMALLSFNARSYTSSWSEYTNHMCGARRSYIQPSHSLTAYVCVQRARQLCVVTIQIWVFQIEWAIEVWSHFSFVAIVIRMHRSERNTYSEHTHFFFVNSWNGFRFSPQQMISFWNSIDLNCSRPFSFMHHTVVVWLN